MKKKGILSLLVIAVVTGVLLLSMTSPVSACEEHQCHGDCWSPSPCGTQAWLLDSVGRSSVPGVLAMTKNASSITPGSVTIPVNTCQIWCADEVAKTDVTFPDGTWTILVHTSGYWDAEKCDVTFGSYANGSFTAFQTKTPVEFEWRGTILEFHQQSAAANVREGCYLAVRICNRNGSSHTVLASRCYQWISGVTSPCSDPGYPVPEANTAILFGAGILGLGGFAYLRLRHQAPSR